MNDPPKLVYRSTDGSEKLAIIPTISHELTHWMEEKSPELYHKVSEFVLDALEDSTGKTRSELVTEERKRITELHPEVKVTDEYAVSELVARACEDCLANSKKMQELLGTMTEAEQKTFIEKIKEAIQNLIDWVNELLSKYKSNTNEAKIMREQKAVFEELLEKWDAMLEDAIKKNQALQKAEQSKKTTKNQEQFADRQVVPELADKLTESEWRYFKKQVGHLKEGNHYEKSANGDIMIPVFNKLVYTDGKYNNPGISKIVEFVLEYEGEIDEARRRIYDTERTKSEIEEAYRVIENAFGQGSVNEYTSSDNESAERYDRRTERGKSKSDTYHREFLQDRIRDANEVIRSASTGEVKYSDRNASYKTDAYYSKITPAARKDAETLNMLDERNIARYRKEIDGVFDGSLPTGSDVIIGMPSEVLLRYGVSNRTIHMTQRIVRKIAYPLGYKIGDEIVGKPSGKKEQGDMGGKHDLGISAVKNLPLQIADPIAITKNNKKNNNSIVLWTNWIAEDGQGVMLGLVIDGKGITGLQNNVSTVFQAEEGYAKQFFENEKDILYTKNNKDINQLLSSRRHVPKAMVDDTFIKNIAENYPDVNYYSDRTPSIYDMLGENEALQKRNKILEQDIERLKERLKLERKVTNGNVLGERQLKLAAEYFKKKVNSTYDTDTLVEELRELYDFMSNEEDFTSEGMQMRAYGIARSITEEQKLTKIENPYYKDVLHTLRSLRISLSEEQIQEARKLYGDKYRNAFWGKITLAKDGVSLNQVWQELAYKYPKIFDKDVTGRNQVIEILDIYVE